MPGVYEKPFFVVVLVYYIMGSFLVLECVQYPSKAIRGVCVIERETYYVF